jgi:hypothetical protein
MPRSILNPSSFVELSCQVRVALAANANEAGSPITAKRKSEKRSLRYEVRKYITNTSCG